MKVTAIMATCGRHYCSERSLSFFLNQNYDNKHLLIYQNSSTYQQLSEMVDRKKVTLINCCIDQSTGRPYSSLGAIYNDAIRHIPLDTDVVIFWDDDDIFSVNHITEGVKGLVKGGRAAYKPERSYFRGNDAVCLEANNLEPSIFVKVEKILAHGFKLTTTDQHFQWLNPLIESNDLVVDPSGVPTLMYNWGDQFDTFKTSGDAGNPDNFENYRINSSEHGDGVISVISVEKCYQFFPTIHYSTSL